MILDKIYIISLKSCHPRRDKIEKWLPESENVIWWIVKRDKVPRRGCFSSHVDILKDAKSKNYNNILILEDDAIPTMEWDQVKKHIQSVKMPKMWTYLMVGYYPVKMIKTSNKHLLGVKCAFTTHAYIANINNIDIPKWNGKHIDDELFCSGSHEEGNMMDSKFKNIYAYIPMLFVQRSEKSTINDAHLHIQRALEFFGPDNYTELSTHVNTTLLIVFLFIILVIIVLALIFGSLSVKQIHPGLYATFALFCLSIIIFSSIIIYDLDNPMDVN